MKTPKDWIKCQDWAGGEYDTPGRMEKLVGQVMLEVLDTLANSPCARVDAREWAKRIRSKPPAPRGIHAASRQS